MSDLFQNQLDRNVGIRPGCHYFLKYLKVILISSRGGKLLADEVFPLKNVQLLAAWRFRGGSGGISLSLTSLRSTQSHSSTPAFMFLPAILFSSYAVRAPPLLGHTPPVAFQCRPVDLCGWPRSPSLLLPPLAFMTPSPGPHSVSPSGSFPVSFLHSPSFV